MILHYLLSLSLIWGFSLLVYLLWLRDNSQYNHSRYFLIGTFCAGLLFPAIKETQLLIVDQESILGHSATALDKIWTPIPTTPKSPNQAYTAAIAEPRTAVEGTTESIPPSISQPALPLWQLLLLSLYFLGLTISLTKYLLAFYKIRKIHTAGKKILYDEHQLVVHNKEVLPFSFFNYIYLHQNLLDKAKLKTILQHEQTHINERHSVDRVFFGFMKVLFWFHPLVYLYNRLIREAHEFSADKQACIDTVTYSEQLIAIVDRNTISLANNFYDNNLKRRILMLNNKSEKSSWPYFLFAPLFIGLIIVTSCNTTDNISSSEYEVGAEVEKVIQDNYFDLGAITDSYSNLKKEHPEHLEYIQTRIQKHFAAMSSEILFDENEIMEKVKNQPWSPNTGDPMIYYITNSATSRDLLPTLQPIRTSDLKEKVEPGARYNPIKRKKVHHQGVDYVAALGSDVLAAGEGLITSIQHYETGFGKCIKIDHDNGMETFYAHLSEILVEEGDYVKKGSLIAKVGFSGLATRPHLHFELTRDGQQWDYEVLSQTVE